jgi:hypothetical protein
MCNQGTLSLSSFFRMVEADNLPFGNDDCFLETEHEAFFDTLGIMIATPRQGEPSWFIAHMFSITSTAANLT